jgi:hypothetical protein
MKAKDARQKWEKLSQVTVKNGATVQESATAKKLAARLAEKFGFDAETGDEYTRHEMLRDLGYPNAQPANESNNWNPPHTTETVAQFLSRLGIPPENPRRGKTRKVSR